MDSDKINPQPEPPGGVFNILGWLWYILRYVFWAVFNPFRYLA
jgi:hypothetical protein